MRKIKFRRYNYDTNEMENIKHIDFNTKTNEAYMTRNYMINGARTLQSSPIMQFTELKDKHGEDIYEGDILKDNRTNEIFFVKFSVGEFVAVIKDKEVGRLAVWLLGDKCEILGNIYQNKELLK